MSTYTIGKAAERSGFSPSALRYYEDHGLLEPASRGANGYRLYDDGSLARLQFIARGKELGCSLDEIAELASLWEADDCGPVQARLHELVTNKIVDAQRRSAELVQFTAQLQTAAAHLGDEPDDGPCDDECACMVDGWANTETESVPAVLDERAEPALACTLSSDDMPAQIDNWHQILTHVTTRDRMPDGALRLQFDSTVPLDELTRLAVAEQGCCSFFAFSITIDQRGAALEVRAPDSAGELVTAVFENVA